MLRYLNYIIYTLVTLIFVNFAFANREFVVVSLFAEELNFIGFNFYLYLPLFAVFFIGAVIGFMIGRIIEWVQNYKSKVNFIRKNRKIENIQRQLQKLSDENQEDQEDILSLLEKTTKEMKKSASL